MSIQDTRCPYTIQHLYTTSHSRTYLIREKDAFGEYPNIYVKVQLGTDGQQTDVIILSDSGTGLDVSIENDSIPSALVSNGSDARRTRPPKRWNIATFLELTLNPGHAAPYLVMTTHCHYDHICGIQHLLNAETDVTVLSSSYDKGFLTPWRNLQKHSLCDLNGLKAPKYDARFVDDAQRISYDPKGHGGPTDSSITVIHTPGHTPDSMSWYDHDTYTLCVGDMFYERESDETRSGSSGHWTREPPQPVIFTKDSNIVDWNASMHRLLDFVRYENRKLGTNSTHPPMASPGYRQNGQGIALDYTERATHDEEWSMITAVPSRRRVALCAGHVTIATDAEFALLNMLAFMLRIQLDQVPKKKVDDIEGNDDAWLWDDSLPSGPASSQSGATEVQFSVSAPWSVIHRVSSTDSTQNALPQPKSRNADFRSMVPRMSSAAYRSVGASSLKSNALASVSHSSVMADRPAVKVASIARKG
ncbi:hypothetical protein OHC33_009771 [Knufia fluminis]|uniref:Metallo-beta-lactamase domain-containing protein n=1 Tax=Knufia fluminis TaxID=191047 RepID=A0AAN8EGQ8_9EURO|nr:hypothetical protein OHC33_009771 [Knufia fluminis]